MGCVLSCLHGLTTMWESQDNTDTRTRPESWSPNGIKRAKVFSFKDLATATKDFRSKLLLGRGGFGSVYKGQLKNGQDVAVRVLDKNTQQRDEDFVAEVEMLSPLHHQNLVTLIGYCCEPDHWLLVYEYMPLGSLENHLFDLHPSREPLDWNTRMKIASGVAKGLEYLHILGDRPAIFGDFKSSNILLGEGYHPKLSDIRMANFGRLCNSSDASTSVGTYGYCAPEYVVTGHLTPECNVYAFGMVLLELISGVKAIDKSRSPEPYHKWAQPIFKDSSELYRLVDPLLDGSYPVAWLHGVIGVADMCLHEDADRRPVIREVVSALTYLESEYNDPEKQCNRRGSKPPTFFYSSLRIKESGLEKEQKKQEFQGGICRYAADTGKRIVRIHNRMRPF